MTNKVAVTQEQADAIEIALTSESSVNKDNPDGLINLFAYNTWSIGRIEGVLEPIGELSVSRLARALYIGYEVEPEYKKGDWIIAMNGIMYQIEEVEGDGLFRRDNQINIRLSQIKRHATPQEIVKEKERKTEIKLDKILLDLSNAERVRLHGKLNVSNADRRVIEALEGHDVDLLIRKSVQLKQSDGEGWAVGEMLRRAITKYGSSGTIQLGVKSDE